MPLTGVIVTLRLACLAHRLYCLALRLVGLAVLALRLYCLPPSLTRLAVILCCHTRTCLGRLSRTYPCTSGECRHSLHT